MTVRIALLTVLALTGLQWVVGPIGVRHRDYGVVTSVQFLEGAPMQRIQELGVGSVRISIDWNVAEPLPGRYDLGDFARVQGWIRQARASGMHVFATLEHPPMWAAPCANCMPTNLFDWYAFVAHVIDTFRDLGNDITFGVWNEPNLDHFLFPSSPDLYGDLFDYANMARMDVNPSARLAGPETEFGAEPSGFFAAALARMTPRLRPQDVITVHWYPGNLSPPLTDYMQRILARVGERETWLTETGERNPDDTLQAPRLLNIVDVFNHRWTSQWSKIFIYRLWAPDPLDPDTPYNLVHPDLSVRPSFDAYRTNMYRVFTVSLRAANGRYLRPDVAPAGLIRALGDTPDGNATFQLYDFNGGSLESGDLIRIQAADGTFLHATGRNRPLVASDSCGCADDGVFVVSTAPNSTNNAGQLVLKSNVTGQYVSLDGGRAADILVNRNSAGARETFTITIK